MVTTYSSFPAALADWEEPISTSDSSLLPVRNTVQVTWLWTELRSSVSRRVKATWAPPESQFLNPTLTQGRALFFCRGKCFLVFHFWRMCQVFRLVFVWLKFLSENEAQPLTELGLANGETELPHPAKGDGTSNKKPATNGRAVFILSGTNTNAIPLYIFTSTHSREEELIVYMKEESVIAGTWTSSQ